MIMDTYTSPMCSLLIKVLPATDTKGKRYRVYCDNTPAVTYPDSPEFGYQENILEIVHDYCKVNGWITGYDAVIGGGCGDYVAVVALVPCAVLARTDSGSRR